MSDDNKGSIINQTAWILNYQPQIKEQHIHVGKQAIEDEPKNESKTTKSKGGRPKKVGKANNKAFIYGVGEEYNKRLQLFYNGLLGMGWIRDDTQLKDFLSIFSGKDTDSQVVWTGDINTLTALFKELVNVKGYLKLPQGESIWVMVNARFRDKAVNKEFGNERLGATRIPVDNKELIEKLVRIMNPEFPIEQLKEMMQSQ